MPAKTILLLLLTCAAPLLAAAQESLFFRQITTNNGLSHNKVNCILEDSRGFFWIGTEDGLNRYDGSNVTVFRHQPGNPASLGGNTINCLAEDEQGILWIGTAGGGLSRYDHKAPAEKQFITYHRTINNITAIYCQPGFVWLATAGRGLVRLHTATGAVQQLPIKKSTTFLSLVSPRPGILWAGSQGGGIITINLSTRQTTIDPRYDSPYKKLPHVVVTSLFKDSHNNIWIGSWDKTVYGYLARRDTTVTVMSDGTPLPGDDDAQCFAEDDAGSIWMGTANTGLYVYNPRSQSARHYTNNPALEGTLADNTVYCLYKDRQGNMWTGTNKGISLYKPSQQQFNQQFLPAVNGKPVAKIFDFYQDSDRRLYIGTDKGLFIQDANGIHYHPLTYKQQPLQVTCFYQYQGQLLLGTNYTLFRYNPVTGQYTPLPDKGNDVVMNRIIESRIVSMAADTLQERPVLWAVAYGHYIAYYDVAAQRWVSRLDSSQRIIERLQLKDNLVKKFWVDAEGTRWMATVKEGLARMRRHDSAFTYFSSANNSQAGLGAVHIYDLLKGGGDTLWVSTAGGGLYRLQTGNIVFTHIAESPNLCEGLQRDAKGHIWFIANGRLRKYEPATGQLSSWQVPDLEKSGGINGYLFKDGAGYLYAAGSNYFICFNPATISKMQAVPKVYITNILVNAVPHPDYLYRDRNRFSFRQNTISFQFAAPQAPDEEAVQYEYRLGKGAWQPVLTNNTVSFPSLPPGRYTFEVRASGPGPGASTAAFSFRIIPPFYQTWWFYTLCALALAGAVYLFYRYRINELVKRQAIRNKIARDLHDNIGSTLGSISVYGRVGAIHNQQGNHKELGEILERISLTSSDMINEMNDIVWAINPGNDSMQKIIDRMHAFAAPLLTANQIQFTLQAQPAVQKLNLDMEQRNGLYLVFKECLHNALKYAACKHIQASLFIKSGRLHFVFTDDGQGFNIQAAEKTAKLGGAGLPGMRQRATEMKGQLEITSSPGQGTTVHLQFPV